MPSSDSRSKSKSSPENGEHKMENQKKQKRKSSRERRKSSSSPSPKGRSRSNEARRNKHSSPPRGRRDADKIPKGSKLFITNIDSKYTSEEIKAELENIFSIFGKIKDTIVKTKPGSSNSYAFIEFEETEQAVRAQEEMRNKDFKGKELKVEFGRGERKQQDRKTDRCYICHKEGHFAKECKYNRQDFVDERDRRDRRDYRESDRSRYRDRHYYNSRSRSNSSSRSYRRRRERSDNKRRDYRRSPQRKSDYRRY